MVPFIQVENVSKRYGDLLLFDNVSFTIGKEQKVAMIARNGAGKTSLLDIISGKDTPDAGKVTLANDIVLGYLEQVPALHLDNTVIEEIFATRDPRIEIVKAYEHAVLHNDDAAVLRISAQMDQLNAWETEVEVKQILTRLKIDDLDARVGHLSGGQQKRLGLAKVLISKPDVMILDEPTNHLDMDMIEWLERYLSKNSITLLMVTHDRYFLDRVCDEILEMDDNGIIRYKGNYSYFVEKRAERIDARQAGIARAQNLLRSEQEWMRRMPKARSHKARYRVEAFSELQRMAKDLNDEKQVELNIKSKRLGKKILEIRELTKSLGGNLLINAFSYTFSRFEKIGIVGDNGTGKSTFLNLVTGLIEPDSGEIETGQTIRFGYYRQDGIEFKPGERVIDAVNKIAEFIHFEDGNKMSASQMLTRFLFPPATQYDFIEKLSGGEKRRLYLCTVLMQNPNFLILDEPTNDLDLLTLNVLEEYLAAFDGCVIVVSHDRFFMDKIVDQLFIFEGEGRIAIFAGNYTQFRNDQEDKASLKKYVKKETLTKVDDCPPKPVSTKLSFKEKQELKVLEEDIGRLESEKKQLEEELNSGMLEHGVLFSKSRQIEAISLNLHEKELRWLELSERDEA